MRLTSRPRSRANPVEGQALWGFATAAAGLVIAVMSPVLGAIADAGGRRKPWIAAFGAAAGDRLRRCCGSAGRATPRPLPFVLAAFAIGTIGAEFATVFNNAMMPTLVPPERIGRLSGTGWATGYAGGLVSLVIVLGFLAANPQTGKTLLGVTPLFGLDPAMREGDRARRAAHGGVVHRVRRADVPVHAGPAGRACRSARGGVARLARASRTRCAPAAATAMPRCF